MSTENSRAHDGVDREMQSRPEYPAARRSDVWEERAGVRFPDPYRWLEQSTEEVRSWQRAQAKLASEYVRRWPGFEVLRRSVARLHVGRPTLPRHAGGYWFRLSQREGSSQAQVVTVSASARDAGRVLFDPCSENPDRPPFISWLSPAPSGRILALGVCADGSENNTIRLIDVATGALLQDVPNQVLMDSWLGGVHWLADSSGFYFTGLSGSTQEFRQAIYFHRIGGPRPVAAQQVPIPTGSRDYRGAMVSRCGRWAVAIHGILTPAPVALRDLSDPKSTWREFVTGVAESVAGHIIGKHYVAITTQNAPCGRVVAIDVDSPTPNDPASWKEVIPESEGVLRSLIPIGERLYLTELLDTYARVRIFDLTGKLLEEMPLPGRGAVADLGFPMMELFAKQPADEFVFNFSSLTASWGTYLHRPGTSRLETLIEPKVRIENAIVEDHWGTSPDGTRVPYHVVRLAGVKTDRPQPTLLYAYGSGGRALNPQFPDALAAFVEAGGVFVHAHLRGGGEFGVRWWQSGVLKNRQNAYADLYSIAENLIARSVTAPHLLIVTGASAGGLMAGVALTQRPELWRAVIPRVPVLDVVGGCREPYLHYVAALEFGDPDDPQEVQRLAHFSPYQLIQDGREYPAVYIDAGDTDPRCPAWHARKFAARLQAAQSGGSPILMHIWENAGHGWATAKDVEIDENTEWLAFAMQQVGMSLEDERDPEDQCSARDDR